MTEEQTLVPVTPGTLTDEVRRRLDQGWRLVQIGATVAGDLVEVNYSFDRDLCFHNVRLQLHKTALRVPSVSGLYWCAFLYENELHDLFGITFEGLVLDFKGALYKTAVPTPFAPGKGAPGVSTTVVQPRV